MSKGICATCVHSVTYQTAFSDEPPSLVALSEASLPTPTAWSSMIVPGRRCSLWAANHLIDDVRTNDVKLGMLRFGGWWNTYVPTQKGHAVAADGNRGHAAGDGIDLVGQRKNKLGGDCCMTLPGLAFSWKNHRSLGMPVKTMT
jgi:hypothetical protein